MNQQKHIKEVSTTEKQYIVGLAFMTAFRCQDIDWITPYKSQTSSFLDNFFFSDAPAL